ncbi:hypothetical protein K0651_07390 [Ornithinimicrobium sp. Arc0846-15]|nr:hypothetical protein [Ornithinimicrobium laminariae]
MPDPPDAVATEAKMVIAVCHPKFSGAERIVAYTSLDNSMAKAEGTPAELGG